MPAVAALGGFAQNDLVLAEFAEQLGAFAAELVGIGFERCDESIERAKTFLGLIPLRWRKTLEQVGIATALLDEESHGVFVGGEELEQGLDPAVERKFLDGTFVARDDAAVYVDVVARVFSLDHDVHRGCHGHECSAGGVVN